MRGEARSRAHTHTHTHIYIYIQYILTHVLQTYIDIHTNTQMRNTYINTHTYIYT